MQTWLVGAGGYRSISEGETCISNEELNILEPEWGGFSVSVHIFPWAKQKEECNDDHVRDGLVLGVGWVGLLGEVGNVADDTDGYWFHATRRWVFLLPSSNGTLYSEINVASSV